MSQPRLVLYARTSTDDQQSPEDSLGWQVSLAKALTSGRADIVAVVHETDCSRSIPWARRPRASQLLAELYDADRGWDGIVVGEPQRAFGSAMQVQTILPQFADAGVTLWCPEVGGPVDPHSEAHDLMLNLFGGLSKAERRRLQTRVRAAKQQQVTSGRFQGGRPPYGYRLVPTETPHPNPEKARWGVMLQCLEVDPETAPWVQKIFAWRIEGLGWKAIAEKLDGLAVPCPSAFDPERNPHRSGRAWGTTTVQQIVKNPRYRGDDAYGRYRKVERLYDRHDPSAGYVSKLVPQPENDWVMVKGAVPALVSSEEWTKAQPEHAPTGRGGRRYDGPSQYALRGLIRCQACGRVMQGSTSGRAAGRLAVHYRCVYRNAYPADSGHAKRLTVAENRLLPLIDRWLDRLFDADHIDATIAALIEASGHLQQDPPEVIAARRAAKDAEERLDRHIRAINSGIDPALLVDETRQAQADLAKAQAVLDADAARHATSVLTQAAVRSVLLRHQGLPGLLRDVATADERRQLYAGLGLTLTYERRQVHGQTRELCKPSIAAPAGPADPWSNYTCRRGDLNPHVLADTSPSS